MPYILNYITSEVPFFYKFAPVVVTADIVIRVLGKYQVFLYTDSENEGNIHKNK